MSSILETLDRRQRKSVPNRIRSPRLTASDLRVNVDKGSRQIRSVTSGKGLAPALLNSSEWNCHGQGESDCLIKT